MTNEPMGDTLLPARHVTSLLSGLTDAEDPRLTTWREAPRETQKVVSDGVEYHMAGVHVRTEYVRGERAGEVWRFENGELVSVAPSSPANAKGEIYMFRGGKHVRTEFVPGHVMHGFLNHLDDNGLFAYTTFAVGHEHHGEVWHCPEGCMMKIEFMAGHQMYGCISYFHGDEHVRTEFEEWHAHHGHILHIVDGTLARIEFAAHHELHGHIMHIEGDAHVRTEFAEGHPKHGTVVLFKDGKPTVV